MLKLKYICLDWFCAVIQMGYYRFIGLLTVVDPKKPEERNWETLQELGKHIARLGISLDYYVQMKAAAKPALDGEIEPFRDEYEQGLGEREEAQLLWKRMSPVKKGQNRLYFTLLKSPVDNTVDEALTNDLRPSIRPPLDDALSGSGESEGEIRIFRFLKGLWQRPEVVDGIFARFEVDLQWPDLDEYKCTFEDLLTEVYHIYDKRGFRAASYYVEK